VGATSRPPDCISLDVHRDHPHLAERVIRWTSIGTLTLLCLLGLANVFGQRHRETTVTGGGATLEVFAPQALRSGLIFQGRFSVVAEDALERPTLALDRGWFEAITVNTIQPEPAKATSENGDIVLEFEPLAAGRTLTVYAELTVNPTTIGRRKQGVELRDGERTLARLDRTIMVYP
jgi:hypothetical protein